MAELALGDLDDVWTLTTPPTPIPYSPTLEDAFLPDADAIARSVLDRPARRRLTGGALMGKTFGLNAVDWEQRVDVDRLRRERLDRVRRLLGTRRWDRSSASTW